MSENDRTDPALAALQQALQASQRSRPQAQVLASTCERARVVIHSKLDPAISRAAGLHPVDDLQGAVDAILAGLPRGEARVAVLPSGPLTIPYVDVAEPVEIT